MTKYILSLTLWACLCLGAVAQPEQTIAFTDKDCYLAGERLQVSVRTLTPDAQPQELSRVAYVELSDTARLCAQTMVALDEGMGWACLPLPATLHSGNYMLTVYTRNMRNYGAQCFFRKVVSVVNPLRLSERDNLLILPPDELPAASAAAARYAPGKTVRVSLPADSAMTVHTLSVVRWDIPTADYALPAPASPTSSTGQFLPEVEGHLVSALPTEDRQIANTRLVLIGKGASLFDGQAQQDGSWLYYTNQVYGALPTLLNAYDSNGQPVGIQFQAPYAQVVPASLPALQVWVSEDDLRSRSLGAQYENMLSQQTKGDTILHSANFFSFAPERYYDLDEYTRFNTVKEALVEFVRGVRRRKVNGVYQLYTYNSQEDSYASWPSLVLLDGMPVHDVDEILAYDARLIKYIQVYSGSYTFGNTICQGVLSFISRRGRLSNFKLDEGSHLVTYNFPQNRPAFVLPESGQTSTVLWDPSVGSRQLDFPAPMERGTYQVILQGLDAKGKPFRSASELVVE